MNESIGQHTTELDAAKVRQHERELEKVANEPTQVKRPWRTVFRSVVAIAIAAIPAGTMFFQQTGLDAVPAIGTLIALGALITRLMAMPEVELFLEQYAPWLAANPYRGKHRQETKDDN